MDSPPNSTIEVVYLLDIYIIPIIFTTIWLLRHVGLSSPVTSCICMLSTSGLGGLCVTCNIEHRPVMLYKSVKVIKHSIVKLTWLIAPILIKLCFCHVYLWNHPGFTLTFKAIGNNLLWGYNTLKKNLVKCSNYINWGVLPSEYIRNIDVIYWI